MTSHEAKTAQSANAKVLTKTGHLCRIAEVREPHGACAYAVIWFTDRPNDMFMADITDLTT